MYVMDQKGVQYVLTKKRKEYNINLMAVKLLIEMLHKMKH